MQERLAFRENPMRLSLAMTAAVACAAYFVVSCADEDMDCSPGEISVCSCDNGSTGVRECSGKGTWGSCGDCDGSGCVPGAIQACPCLGGGEGIQECSESGDSWGDCQGCEDTELGECDYTTCTGDICAEPEDCCDNTACGSYIFTEEWGAAENYCYPMCDPEAETDPCKCGDVCVDFGDGFSTCLGTSAVTVNNLSLPVGADVDASVFLDTQEVDVDYTATLGDETIAFDFFYAYWDDTEMILEADGFFGSNGIWILFVVIPEAIMEAGVGEYPVYDEENNTFNFSVELYSGTLDSDYKFEEVWLETPFVEDAVIAIEQTCEPCTADAEECEACEFSLDSLMFAMRTKLQL